MFDYSILTEFELDSVVVDCHRGLLLEKQWERQSKTTMNRLQKLFNVYKFMFETGYPQVLFLNLISV